MKEFRMSPWMDAWDRVAKDATERAEAREPGEHVEHNHTETYYAALDAAVGVAALLKDYQHASSELMRLQMLESYQADQKLLLERKEAIERLQAQLAGYINHPLNQRVAQLESELRIARKANHLEALTEAEHRISELERKLEEIELNG